MTDRSKIEYVCKIMGCKIKKMSGSTIIDSRRYYFNKYGEITKVLEYNTFNSDEFYGREKMEIS